ncbi:MAG: hypothetical protein ACT4PL_08075 [Phycisphaerales bacterium]
MSTRILSLALATASFASFASFASAAVMVSDGTFADANWTCIPNPYGIGGGTGSGAQTASGREGTGRLTSNSANPTFSGSYNVHLFTTFVYDPASAGPLTELAFTIDSRFLNGLSAIGFAIEQGGTLWYTGYELNTSSWATYTHVPAPADFFNLPFGAPATLPDFSASGAPIRFGFYSANGTGGGAGYTNSSVFDNFAVSFVPAPSAVALGGAGLLLALRRRR